MSSTLVLLRICILVMKKSLLILSVDTGQNTGDPNKRPASKDNAADVQGYPVSNTVES